jgi:hypothetical protein
VEMTGSIAQAIVCLLAVMAAMIGWLLSVRA